MNARTLLLPLLALPLFAAGCGERGPTSPASLPIAEPGTGALRSVRTVTGQTGRGALYAFHVPDNWNGSLVLYVHGFHDAAEQLRLPYKEDVDGLRDGLTRQGFAVGYSSFSENGWAVRDGAQRTHQLRGLFASSFGKPRRVYLVGHSLGSLIAVNLVEKHPELYDGVMPICGIIGGGQTTVSYIGNVRLLFDFFYPGALPGSVIDPAGLTAAEVQARAQTAMLGNVAGGSLNGAFMIQQVMQQIGMPIPVVGSTPMEQAPTLVGSIVYALAFHVRGFDDLASRTHGHQAFDNSRTDYVLPLVQRNIPRFQASPDARSYLRNWYEPTGNLQVPMVALDPTLDPIAPLFHKDRYAHAVAANGASDRLVRRTVPTYGHCAVPTSATLGAFAQLVGWAESGVRP
jgi:pimeloyl-ACP methyl ester carboxylesterase